MRKILYILLIGVLFGGCNNIEIEKKIQNSILAKYNNPPKIKSFSNVEKLKETLTDKSSLNFNRWRKSKFINEEDKWFSNTGIIQFGKHSKNGFQNDIGYVLLGKEKDFINEVQIVLNIKNPDELEESLSSLAIWSKQTFGKLKIDSPINLNKSILNGDQYYYENELSYILLRKQNKSETNYNIHPEKKIDKKITYQNWKLIIKSK